MYKLFKLLSFLAQNISGVRYPRLMILLILLISIVGGMVSAAFIPLINTLMHQTAERSQLIKVFLVLCLLLPLTNFTSTVLLVRLSQRIMYELRMKLCRAILDAPLSHLEGLGAARLTATVTEDIIVIAGMFNQLPGFVLSATMVLACVGYLAWLSWKIFLMFTVFLIIGAVTYQIPMNRAQQHYQMLRSSWDKLLKSIRGMTEGIKELKIHDQRRESFFNDLLGNAARSMWKHQVASRTIYALAHSWGQVVFFIFIGVMLFGLPFTNSMDLETLTGYTMITLFIMAPLNGLMNMMPAIGQATIAMETVEKLRFSLTENATNRTSAQLAELSEWKTLELDEVVYNHKIPEGEQSFTLGPINLTFRSGELIFLVGGNGSGKTTLVKLLIGLYSPDLGEIRLDNQVVSTQNRSQYRQLFSVVFSDFYLFENLLGLDDLNLDGRANHYLQKLQLDHKVQVEEGRLSTLKLSQGQRKRLALLTAYLEDRPICVFDEWAADQDPLFKEVFYREFLPELKARGKTVIVISHDNHYYDAADRIVKLDYGQIESNGEE